MRICSALILKEEHNFGKVSIDSIPDLQIVSAAEDSGEIQFLRISHCVRHRRVDRDGECLERVTVASSKHSQWTGLGAHDLELVQKFGIVIEFSL